MPTAVALVMHGGAVDGHEPNRPWSHNVARLVPFARALQEGARARSPWRDCGSGSAAGTATAMPVEDARWALAQVRAAYPGVPSPSSVTRWADGSRCSSATSPTCASSSGWRPGSSPATRAPGPARRTVLHPRRPRRHLLPRAGRAPRVEQMQAEGLDASLVRVARADHAMLVRARVWTALVTEVVQASFARELGGTRRAAIRPHRRGRGSGRALRRSRHRHLTTCRRGTLRGRRGRVR